MRGTIYNGVEDISLAQDLSMPVCGPKDVVVRNVRAGICGTDLHAYEVEGESVGILPGNQFGHELVGMVHEVGAEVKDVAVGMRVFVDPNLRKPLGQGLNATQIADMTGAFSEYILVENAELDYNLYELDDSLEFDRAVLTEPFSVSMHGVNICQPKPGEKAIIYGAGTIGLCTIPALINVGITDIIISDIVDSRLEMARQLGATPVNTKDQSVMDFAKELWGTKIDNMGLETVDADIVIDCAGYPGIVEEFMANAKAGSRLSIVALSGAEEKVVPYMFVAKEVSILGSRGYKTKDIKQVLAALTNPETVISPIITAEYGLSDIEEAFEVARDKDNQIKVVINHEK